MVEVQKYFKAERRGGVLLLILGTFFLCVSFYFLGMERFSYSVGFSISFIVIALIQLGVGIVIFVRSPKDLARVEGYVNNSKESIQGKEIPRMKKVMRSFTIYLLLELILIIIGFLLLFVFNLGTLSEGLGLGLIIQTSIMLVFDLFALRRGRKYVTYLKKLDF